MRFTLLHLIFIKNWFHNRHRHWSSTETSVVERVYLRIKMMISERDKMCTAEQQLCSKLLPLPCVPGPRVRWSLPPCHQCPDTGRGCHSHPSHWSPSHEAASAPFSHQYSCNNRVKAVLLYVKLSIGMMFLHHKGAVHFTVPSDNYQK